ncbi:heat shock 70 kDa protein 12A-like [Mytilus californianus]|uniref:heat shock 70 kDa protein 12A-like n=1 Tax=Mytilus californianus TaxID=6549 RepID=UPI0022470FD2|nr:heat shock 70 kDa protein 12A-like [Mytilus californianus]
MELYHNENISDKLQIKDVKGKQIPAIKVFSNMIYKLKERMEMDIKNEYTGSSFSPSSIQWVLTIPAKWTDRAETFIRKCAEKAGIRSDQLMIIVESESASVYIHHLLICNKLDLPLKELPTEYLVIDLGGGTNDITAHKISKRGKLRELCKPSGNVHGGTKVDKYLFSCFERIVGDEVVHALKDKGSYLELLEQFESVKNFITSSTAKKVACKIPLNLLNELCEKYNKKSFNVLLEASKYSQNMSLANDRLRIDRPFIERYISEVASGIMKDIKYVLFDKAQSRNISTFFVVGGFSNSKLVRQKLSDEFPNVAIIYPPDNVELAVVRGAVMYGKNPNYIKPSSNKAHLR